MQPVHTMYESSFSTITQVFIYAFTKLNCNKYDDDYDDDHHQIFNWSLLYINCINKATQNLNVLTIYAASSLSHNSCNNLNCSKHLKQYKFDVQYIHSSHIGIKAINSRPNS